MSDYSGPVCRGSWALGTACGKCERCLETKPPMTTRKLHDAAKVMALPTAHATHERSPRLRPSGGYR